MGIDVVECISTNAGVTCALLKLDAGSPLVVYIVCISCGSGCASASGADADHMIPFRVP